MKRLIIALIIVVMILSTGSLSAYRIYQFQKEGLELLEQMEGQTKSGHLSMAAQTAQEFHDLWFDTEDSLIQFVRRDPLDHISSAASRLPALGQYEDLAEFAALTQDLKRSVRDLWESELPYFQNLF